MSRETWDHVKIQNTLRANVFSVDYKHEYKNLREEESHAVVWAGTDVSTQDARYRVGELGSDHWWIDFIVGSLDCRVHHKQCELRRSDEHQTTICKIQEAHRSLELLIRCPESSNCDAGFDTSVRSSRENADHPLPGYAQRPVYVIAHHCNTPGQVANAIESGANAIECDIRYHHDQWMVYHGGIIDPEGTSPTPLNEWLTAARETAERYKSDFALIIFDNKSPDDFASRDYQGRFIDVVRQYLPRDLHLLFSVSSYDDIGYLDPIAKQLRVNEGVAVDESHDCDDVQKHFAELGISNFWFGDGIAALAPEPRGVWYALNAAGVHRDQGDGIKKTYIWTLEKDLSMAEYLSLARVDGVMVSQSCVGRARDIVNGHVEARMAKREDPAFQVFNAK